MTLHTVGPESMGEDEHKIGKSYQTWLVPVYLFGPVLAVQFLAVQEVAFICIGAALANLHEIGGRLHDLCIRHRRTNMLLSDQLSN